MQDVQTPFDVAVVVPTTLRATLRRAVGSVFAQDFGGRVQVVIGIDAAEGPREPLEALIRECPDSMAVTVLDPGYSTSRFRGGLYPVWAGGALRTVLSYLANADRVAYLDDDNWWAPDHLSSLAAAMAGFDWAFSLRWYVDPATAEPMAVDRWESTGPGRGLYAATTGGFVDTNCLMLDKRRCHWVLPAWSVPANAAGAGPDRTVFKALCARHSVGWTGRASAYYTVRADDMAAVRALIAGTAP